MSCEKRTNAIDHSHHLSDLARRYGVSPLKGLQKYFSDDLIPFAGGAHIICSRVLLSYDVSLQACPVPSISPSPRSLPTSSPQTRSHWPRSRPRRRLSRPHPSAGSGASSVPATTIRRVSRFLASHAKAMVDSTSPLRCNTVPRLASHPYRKSSENSQDAYMPPRTRTGPHSLTRATRMGADTIDLARVRVVRSDN